MMTEHYTHLSDASATAMAVSFPKLLAPADGEQAKALPRAKSSRMVEAKAVRAIAAKLTTKSWQAVKSELMKLTA
jgi:hypothetical protein